MREAVVAGRAEFVPIFLSDIPYLYRRKKVSLDVALLQDSTPDKAGFCSLGVSLDTSMAAAECLTLQIAEINPNMPRIHGDGFIHTEMFSDGIIPLIESGVGTNQHKTKHKGYVVAGFMMGSSNLYAYLNDNPLIRVLDIMYVNDTAVIRQLPKVTSINSAIEVDLTAQVCADYLW